MEEQLYTTTKVAKIFGVTPRTIQMWADSGMIQVTKTLAGIVVSLRGKLNGWHAS